MIVINNTLKKCTLPILIVLIIILVTVIIYSKKSITIIVDGNEHKITTLKNTVAKALDEGHIILNSKDKVDKELNSKLTNNEIINIKKAVDVKVEVDGKTLSLKSSESDINSMLQSEKISLGSNDKISPNAKTSLYEGLDISIIRVNSKTITDCYPVDYKTIIKNDDSMAKSQSKLIQDGETGEKQITSVVTYEDGKEVQKKVTSEKIIKAPKDKIIAQGTLSTISFNRGATSITYKKVINVKATAYYAVHGVGNTYTASGRKAVRNPNDYSTIAVDPKVIPLGTKLYVEGYGFAIAADTGTAIRGNFIDVFFNTYNEACAWAVKYPNIYILQ